MHELSIAQNIVQSAIESLNESGAKNITSLCVEVGELSGIVKDCLEFVFPEACRGTPLEHCQLVIHYVSVVLYCHPCDQEFTKKNIGFFCELCFSTDVTVKKGKELKIKSMEVY